MGCECCKIAAPEDYEKCHELKASKKYFTAPCGIDIGNKPGAIGSSYTPPKKKRRKRK